MKTFSNNLNESSSPYSSNDILRNQLLNLIDENLKTDDNAEITGKLELVEKLFNIIDNECVKEQLQTIIDVKSNPLILKK